MCSLFPLNPSLWHSYNSGGPFCIAIVWCLFANKDDSGSNYLWLKRVVGDDDNSNDNHIKVKMRMIIVTMVIT